MNESMLVIAAAIANFVLGGVWYGVLGKQWMMAWGLSEKDIDRKDPKPYLVAFIGSLWASYGMFVMLKHINPNGLVELISVAIGTWLFVFVGMGAKHYAFGRKSLSAFAIDYGLDLIGFILICLILWA
jgi:hypothetical protein